MKFSAISRYSYLALCLLFAVSTKYANSTIVEHPSSTSVTINEWSNFSCSVELNCSKHFSLRWRIVAPMMDEARYHTSKVLIDMWKRRKGITIVAKSDTQTNSEENGCKKRKVETIKILTTSQMDGAVIQCAARYGSKPPSYIYSKFAVLKALPDTTEGSSSLTSPSIQ